MKKSNGSFPHRRRRKYVRPDLQAKLILGSLGITLLVTFIFGPYFASVAAEYFAGTGLDEQAADARAQSVWSLH